MRTISGHPPRRPKPRSRRGNQRVVAAGLHDIAFVRDLVGSGDLMHARRWSSSGNLEVADHDVSSSMGPSIAVDPRGILHISCGGASDQPLRHLCGLLARNSRRSFFEFA